MKRLSELSSGRDNNLSLMRVVAASSVLLSHSYALSTGRPEAEPLRWLLGMTPGTVAVDVFFLISGFLVTASMFRTESLLDFTLARFLRIVPGLTVMLVLTVCVMGPLFSTEAPAAYFGAPQTGLYLAKGLSLFAGVEHELPGVFGSNPFKESVNGSLWTLPYEVRMYASLALIWLLCALALRQRAQAFAFACLVIALTALGYLLATKAKGNVESPVSWLTFMFFTGAAARGFRHRIVLSGAVILVLLVALAGLVYLSKSLFLIGYLFGIGYLTFYLAYVPKGPIRAYNALGDYSYGIYIYAFPVQQMTVALQPGIGPLALFAVSGAVTLLLAMASWHWVEQPALNHKDRWVAFARRRIALQPEPTAEPQRQSAE